MIFSRNKIVAYCACLLIGLVAGFAANAFFELRNASPIDAMSGGVTPKTMAVTSPTVHTWETYSDPRLLFSTEYPSDIIKIDTSYTDPPEVAFLPSTCKDTDIECETALDVAVSGSFVPGSSANTPDINSYVSLDGQRHDIGRISIGGQTALIWGDYQNFIVTYHGLIYQIDVHDGAVGVDPVLHMLSTFKFLPASAYGKAQKGV